MTARFDVERAFGLEERGLFALAGKMTEGMVRVGMTADLEGDEAAFSRPVHGVEFLDEPGSDATDPAASDSGAASPCLTFHCRDRDRMREWLALEWEGRSLVLRW